VRLRRLRIEGIQNLEHVDLELPLFDDGAAVHFLLGANGAGKSTTIESIRLALGGHVEGLLKSNLRDLRCDRPGFDGKGPAVSLFLEGVKNPIRWSPGGKKLSKAELLKLFPGATGVEAIVAALEPGGILGLTPAKRAKLFAAAQGKPITAAELQAKGVVDTAVVKRVLDRGVKSAIAYCEEQRRAVQRDQSDSAVTDPTNEETPLGFLAELDPAELGNLIERKRAEIKADENALEGDRRDGEVRDRIAAYEAELEGLDAEALEAAVERARADAETATENRKHAEKMRGEISSERARQDSTIRQLAGAIEHELTPGACGCPTCRREFTVPDLEQLREVVGGMKDELVNLDERLRVATETVAARRRDEARTKKIATEAGEALTAYRGITARVESLRGVIAGGGEASLEGAAERVETAKAEIAQLEAVRDRVIHYAGQAKKAAEWRLSAGKLQETVDKWAGIEDTLKAIEEDRANDPLAAVRAAIENVRKALIDPATGRELVDPIELASDFEIGSGGRPWQRAGDAKSALVDLCLRAALCEIAGIRILLLDLHADLDMTTREALAVALALIRDRFDVIFATAADDAPEATPDGAPSWFRRWHVLEGSIVPL